MDDDRNHLFRDYRDIVDALSPDGFVFENVTGLLNMQKGRVFRDICAVLGESMSDIRADVLKTEHFGVAQRRWRVFVTARRDGSCPSPPGPLTSFPITDAEDRGLAVTPGAEEAIGDLPGLEPGCDGSNLDLNEATSDYQRLCREVITPEAYLDRLGALGSALRCEQLTLAA
jgi:DNA (cytosine-5)-methyltransferase 1